MSKSNSGLRLTRRQFVAAASAGTAVLSVGCKSTVSAGWESLTDSQAATLAALCDQIVPADDFPSASQAGAVRYIDRQLARHYHTFVDTYTYGIAQAERTARERFGNALNNLAASQQLEVAKSLEKQNREFFDLLRRHTMEGYYGSPRHGGNRDAVSWRMLGLDEPPLRGRAQYDLRKDGRS